MRMSVAIELLSIGNPRPNPIPVPQKMTSLNFSSSSSSMALPPSSLRFKSLLRPRHHLTLFSTNPPKGLGFALSSPSLHRPVVSFAASHEESKPSEIEVEKERDDLKLGAEGSDEEWKQTLEAFKEQALKMQSVSQEAYEVYSKRAKIILEETSEQLRIQAEKARNDLGVLAKEIGEEGKEYLSTAAVNSPEPVKEIVQTFSSIDDINDISKIQDFHVGIPYGLLLSFGGFLSFMITGSLSAIRFGVILGGALLAFSVSSLRSYRKGERYPFALKGQTAIAGIIFLRELLLLSQRASFLKLLATVMSGATVVFYIYRIKLNRKQVKPSDLGQGAEN
ncbi:hypothetical protein K2173_000018 [Erythroxylum novogranatense]|uniref:Protein FATTY ACID EXPORT 3, chloroplastic n=1 Tax=Erythroxylum novogranatense TaxID=1862640 RepID=A0AAV8SP95_9ROSI|nr:hypothetical protein K2173_000018 [Erythroxylum novogranatense]